MNVHIVFRMIVLCLFMTNAHAQIGLKGTHDSQRKENREADEAGLIRIESDSMLEILKFSGTLVKLPSVAGAEVDYRLEEKWSWVRPWVAEFLRDLGHEFFTTHKASLRVSSAVRTVEYQGFLQLINRNAASTFGDRRSTHPTGATIDITKRFLSQKEIKWLRVRLLELEGMGLVEVTEEFFQSVFHIMVFPRYSAVHLATREREVDEK